MKRLLLLIPLILSACGELNPIEAGERAIEEKKWQVAISKYSSVLSLVDEPSVVAFALARRGHARLESGDRSGAMEDFNACLKVNPAFFDALIDRATCYERLGEREKAIDDCSRAIAIKPISPLPWIRRGIYLGRIKKYDESIADFTEALRLEPESLAALFGRSLSFERKGDFKAAITDLEQIRRLQPDYELAEKRLKTLREQLGENEANKAPEPTPGAVTPRATEGVSK